MKKFTLGAVLLMGAAGMASADDFSFSFSFGGAGRHWRPRPAYGCAQPVYYGPVYRPYYYRPVYGYRPSYYRSGGYDAGYRSPYGRVVIRSCD